MIDFEKWHGNGNDFVIVNSIETKTKISKNLITRISDRNKGIGFDQLINICLPTKDDKDFFIKFFNSDGSEAGMCLNGIRCASSYIWNNEFAPKKAINIQTKSKNIMCTPEKNNMVRVAIDFPETFEGNNLATKIKNKINDDFFMLNIGNNHLCIKKESIEKVNLNKMYKKLEAIIKKSDINLSIYKKKGALIDIRTYENGVGETLSCGSASLCIASNFLTEDSLSMKTKSMGGELVFKKDENVILMSGPASFIYKGNINE